MFIPPPTPAERTFHLLLFVLVVARLADVHRDVARGDRRPVKVHTEADVVAVRGELPAHALALGDGRDMHRHDVPAVHRHHAILVCPQRGLQLLDGDGGPGGRGVQCG